MAALPDLPHHDYATTIGGKRRVFWFATDDGTETTLWTASGLVLCHLQTGPFAYEKVPTKRKAPVASSYP